MSGQRLAVAAQALGRRGQQGFVAEERDPAMAGRDPADTATRQADDRRARDYSAALQRDGLKGARIGVVRNRLFGYSPGADALADAAIADLKREGAVIVDPDCNVPSM